MLKLRLMTLNLGGGVKNFTGSPETASGKALAMAELLNQIQPDFLGVQEIAQYIDADGTLTAWLNALNEMAILIIVITAKRFR